MEKVLEGRMRLIFFFLISHKPQWIIRWGFLLSIPMNFYFKAILPAHWLLTVFCSLWFVPTHAQLNFDYTEGKFLIKGQITDIKTNAAVPYANIWIVNQKKGISTDGDGMFTMYVYKGDTLRFSSLGYIAKTLPITAIPEKEKYTLNIQIVPDIYTLKTVVIYPFRNVKEFEQAFVRGDGVPKAIVLPGMMAPTYKHKEKAKFYNPISSIYNAIKAKRRAADPNFKP